MILYTLVPMEQIFDEEDEDKKAKPRRTVDWGGVKLEVEQSSESEYEIVKLISSNPSHFLDSRFQPGNKVTLQPRF